MRNVRMDIMNRGCGRLNIKLGRILSDDVRHDGMSWDPVDELIHEIKGNVRLR
jgi:hypothetical protein